MRLTFAPRLPRRNEVAHMDPSIVKQTAVSRGSGQQIFLANQPRGPPLRNRSRRPRAGAYLCSPQSNMKWRANGSAWRLSEIGDEFRVLRSRRKRSSHMLEAALTGARSHRSKTACEFQRGV